MTDRPGTAPVGAFPKTQVSLVLDLKNDDPAIRERSWNVLARSYWKPVYKYVRLKWRAGEEESQDLTQAFFVAALGKRFLEGYDPAKARFRTYLRVCLDRFVQDDRKASRRVKRGGGALILPLEFEAAEGELRRLDSEAPLDTDAIFDEEWKRCLFSAAVEALRDELATKGRERYFKVFERYDLEAADETKTSYAAVARDLGISVDDVTNWLRFARRDFRRIVMEKLRELSASEEEFQAEARALLGKSG